MANANYVMIDGVAYSPKHKKALAFHGVEIKVAKPLAPKSPKRFQSAEDKLNQTEKKLLVLLRARFGDKAVRIQAIRLELAPGCTYLPDFSVWQCDWDTELVKLTFFECKGAFVRDDALVKLKTAARMYPEFDFWFCMWKNNRWSESLMSK